MKVNCRSRNYLSRGIFSGLFKLTQIILCNVTVKGNKRVILKDIFLFIITNINTDISTESFRTLWHTSECCHQLETDTLQCSLKMKLYNWAGLSIYGRTWKRKMWFQLKLKHRKDFTFKVQEAKNIVKLSKVNLNTDLQPSLVCVVKQSVVRLIGGF